MVVHLTVWGFLLLKMVVIFMLAVMGPPVFSLLLDNGKQWQIWVCCTECCLCMHSVCICTQRCREIWWKIECFLSWAAENLEFWNLQEKNHICWFLRELHFKKSVVPLCCQGWDAYWVVVAKNGVVSHNMRDAKQLADISSFKYTFQVEWFW